MKRGLLFIFILMSLLCFFTLATYAAPLGPEVTDTFYVVASRDSEIATSLVAEGKDVIVLSEVYADTRKTSGSDWIDSFKENSHVELIFAENVVEMVDEYTGILIAKPMTMTVRYNGFVHLVSNTVMNHENMFVLRHSGAKINLLGSSEIYDENGDVIMDFTYSTTNLSANKLQIRHPKVYCWVHDGDAYVENTRSYTGQELVFADSDDSSADPGVRNTYEFVDCALSSGSAAIGLLGQASAEKFIKIDGGYYNKLDLHTICSDSYVKNCSVDSFSLDCWGISNQMLVFENVSIKGSITTHTGRTHLSFYDCKIDVSKFSLGKDGGQESYALVYKTAGCEAGELKVYRNGSGQTPVNSKDVNNDSRYAQVVADFYADPINQGLGHSYEWNLDYEGDKYLSNLSASSVCIRCKGVAETREIGAMFKTLGFSVPEFDSSLSITIGYSINRGAIEQYEKIVGSKISFGFAVALKDKLGEFNAPLDENGNEVVLESGKVLKADITGELHSYMDLKVSLSNEHKDVMLLMTGYIMEENDVSTDISYMQFSNELVKNNQFEYISYNNH